MNDSQTRAMADGRMAVKARTVWQLDIGPMAIRCIASEQPDAYEVQVRGNDGWQPNFASGPDPVRLLACMVAAPGVRHGIEESVAHVRGYAGGTGK